MTSDKHRSGGIRPSRMSCQPRHLRRGLGNRQGSPAGSPRGGARSDRHAPCSGETQPSAPSADAGTVRVPPRGASTSSAPAGRSPADLRATRQRGGAIPQDESRTPHMGGHGRPPPHAAYSGGIRCHACGSADHVISPAPRFRGGRLAGDQGGLRRGLGNRHGSLAGSLRGGTRSDRHAPCNGEV
jgi:hypothetical protein